MTAPGEFDRADGGNQQPGREDRVQARLDGGDTLPVEYLGFDAVALQEIMLGLGRGMAGVGAPELQRAGLAQAVSDAGLRHQGAMPLDGAGGQGFEGGDAGRGLRGAGFPEEAQQPAGPGQGAAPAQIERRVAVAEIARRYWGRARDC